MDSNGNIKIKNNYWSETHPIAKKIGDSLLAAATTGATFAIVNDYKVIGITLMVIGTLGKFLSNMFTLEPNEDNK